MRKWTHAELQTRQLAAGAQPKLPFCLLANNIRSLYNVGSLFRTADAAGVEKIWLCGITGIPPSNRIAKTALDADKVVPWEYRQNAAGLLRELRAQGYETVMLEQTVESIPYQNYAPKGPVCLILGNEIEGVEESLLPHCDRALEIDMAGLKNSLNVTVAFGIVAYHIRQQFLTAVSKSNG